MEHGLFFCSSMDYSLAAGASNTKKLAHPWLYQYREMVEGSRVRMDSRIRMDFAFEKKIRNVRSTASLPSDI